MKNSGLFLNMAKGVFCLFFSGFNVFVVCFCVFGKVVKSVKNACFFSQSFGLFGVACSCLVGFGRFWCFVFLVFVFVCLGIVFVYFALSLFGCWIVFGVVLVFVFGVSFLFFGFVLFVIVCFACLCWSNIVIFFLVVSFWFAFVLICVFVGLV